MLQHFPASSVYPAFHSASVPQLYYVGKILPEVSVYPRILHAHSNHVEISIIYQGESEYMIYDQKQMIRAGDIIIYNSGILHDELSSENVRIGSYFFAIGELAVPGLRPGALIGDDVIPVFHAGGDFAAITALCEDILRTVTATDEWSPVATHFSAMAMLEIIWRIVHKGKTATEQNRGSYLGQAIKAYIDAHYAEALTLQSIGGALHLSESYISHVFKDRMGYSPIQYVMRRRIGEAQTLLITTEYSITKIAQMVGYDSQSHFNQRFSQYVGISPGRFRANYKGKRGRLQAAKKQDS